MCECAHSFFLLRSSLAVSYKCSRLRLQPRTAVPGLPFALQKKYASLIEAPPTRPLPLGWELPRTPNSILYAWTGGWCPGCFQAQETSEDDGAGGGSRTLTNLSALRIFVPSAAFAALAAALDSAGARFAVWTIPSPSPREFWGLGAARLVSTPSPAEYSAGAWLGIAIAGFPEFGQFCIAGFPASTQVCLKSVASAIPPRPRELANHFLPQLSTDDFIVSSSRVLV